MVKLAHPIKLARDLSKEAAIASTVLYKNGYRGHAHNLDNAVEEFEACLDEAGEEGLEVYAPGTRARLR